MSRLVAPSFSLANSLISVDVFSTAREDYTNTFYSKVRSCLHDTGKNFIPERLACMVCSTFTWKFSFWNENAVKASTDRKHESAGQPSQSTCLFPYRNEPVPPQHDTGGTCRQISFWNENFDPMRLPG